MTSPFRSIYDHEKEHQIMMQNKGGDGFVRSFESMEAFNNADEKNGPILIDGKLYFYNAGVLKASNQFLPSIYSGAKSATTTVAGQSELLATGAKLIRVANNDSTNAIYIGLGASASDAESNCSSGTAGVNRFFIPAGETADISMNSYLYYAWLGVSGTVSILITQGL